MKQTSEIGRKKEEKILRREKLRTERERSLEGKEGSLEGNLERRKKERRKEVWKEG